MMGTHIKLEGPREGVACLTLDRAEKKNALSIALRDEVTEALGGLAEDDALKVLILTGRGDAFSAGFDLDEFRRMGEPEFGRRIWESSDAFHRAVLHFPLPTVAAVNGPALAGGFDLAVMCDLRIASTRARFGHPEVRFGDVVYGPLRDLVGGAVARELCLTGRTVEAEEALALRLVSSVVAPEELDDAAFAWAAHIAQAPREILRRTKAKIIRRAAIQPQATLDL